MGDKSTTDMLLEKILDENQVAHERIEGKVDDALVEGAKTRACVQVVNLRSMDNAGKIAAVRAEVDEHGRVLDGQRAQGRLVKWLIATLIAIAGAFGISKITGGG